MQFIRQTLSKSPMKKFLSASLAAAMLCLLTTPFLPAQTDLAADATVSTKGPYPIAYGSLVPKKAECENRFVPIGVFSTHIAYGSIRMEPVFMILGQSAATSAVMAIDSKIAVQDVPYAALRTRLLADGQVLAADSKTAPAT